MWFTEKKRPTKELRWAWRYGSIVFISLWICFVKFRSITPNYFDDSAEYLEVTNLLGAGHFREAFQHSRPPLYPAVLWAARAFEIFPSQAALYFNGACLFIPLFLFEIPTALLLCIPFALLGFSAMYLSFTNAALTESILLGVLLIAVSLFLKSMLLLREKKPVHAGGLLGLQSLLLLALKPAFKGLLPLELLVAFWIYRGKISLHAALKTAGIAIAVWASVLFVLLPNSGKPQLKLNQAAMLIYEHLPDIDDIKLQTWHHELQSEYQKLKICAEVAREASRAGKHIPCPQEINPDLASAVYNKAFRLDFLGFMRAHTIKTWNLVRYSTWNVDYGLTKFSLGFSRGFGWHGLLIQALLLGFLLFLVLKKIPEAGLVFTSSALFAFYGFAVCFWLCATELARFSLIFLFPGFAMLAACFFLAFAEWHERRR